MKKLVTEPHIIFSVNNPKYKGTKSASHEEAVGLLSGKGSLNNVHTIKGSYGGEEESIFISNPTSAQKEQARKLAHETGQESHIESDGKSHKMMFNHGPQAGSFVSGSGTQFHDKAPQDFFSQLPDGTTFTHNFNISKLDKAIQSPSKHIPLARLKQIKQDNSVGETGKEYSEEEVDQAIAERSQSQADKLSQQAGRQKPRADKGSDPKDFPFLRIAKSTNNISYTHTHDPNIDQHRIVAHQDGKPVGGFIFEKTPTGYSATSSQVLKTHRRQGIASGAYKHFEEKTGNKLVPHIGRGGEDKRSDDAKALWNSPKRAFGKSDKIPGGLADKLTNKDFPKNRIDQGRKVELEHTSSKPIAEEIARDHLKEDPKYYDKLKTIEKNDQSTKHPWKAPSTKQINEDVSDWPNFFSKMSEEHGLPEFTNEDIHALIANHGKVVTVPHDQIYTVFRHSHPLSRREVLEDREGYKPSSDSITQAFKEGTPLPMPISFRFPSGGQAVLSGRHRLGHAAENKKDLQVISVPYGIHPSAHPKKISKMEKGARGDWKNEGYKIFHKEEPEVFRGKHTGFVTHHVTAFSPKGEEAGHYQFSQWPAEDEKSALLDVNSANTHPDHQRKGLASAVYSFIENKTGRKIGRQGMQTTAAAKLWSQPNRPFGKSEDVKEKPRYANVKISDLHQDPLGVSNAKKTFHFTPDFKPSNKPVAVGVHVDTGKTYLLDGYHRTLAAQKRGDTHIKARLVPTKGKLGHPKLKGYEDQFFHERAKWSDMKIKKSQDLSKMSRPRITFPNLKDTPTRPDQDVQLIETGRQKDLFGRKAAVASVRDHLNKRPGTLRNPAAATDDSAKRISGKFDRSTLGLNVPLKDRSFSGALAGKARSKYEPADDAFKAKLDGLKEKREKQLEDYHELYSKWKATAETLPSGSNAYWEHVANKPKLPAKPRKPAKSRVDTKDLSPENMKLRGQGVESTVEHEALHSTLHQIHQKYGPFAYANVRDKLLSAHDPQTLKEVGDFISERVGYKRSSPNFSEEVLTHTRDLLVNPRKRENFKEFLKEKHRDQGEAVFNNHFKNLKQGHQKAYEMAQNLRAEDIEGAQRETKLAASELAKAPTEFIPNKETLDIVPVDASTKGGFKAIHTKELPNGLTYAQSYDGRRDLHVHQLFHKDHHEPVAELETRTDNGHVKDNFNTQDHHVAWSQVHPEFKGQGLGKQVYRAALIHGKGVGRLLSDKGISRDANEAWKDLASQPGIQGKLGQYKTKDQSKKDPVGSDIAHEDRHMAQVPDKSKIDQRKLFPKLNIVAKPKKMAASEMGKATKRDLNDSSKFLQYHLAPDFSQDESPKSYSLARKRIHNTFQSAKSKDVNLNVDKVHSALNPIDNGRKVKNNRMQNPIVIGKIKNGPHVLLDGHHRLIQAKNAGIKKIKARIVDLPEDYDSLTALDGGVGLIKNESADKETKAINENKKSPEAQKPHKFSPAKWTHPNGHPRCKICGDEERTGGMCEGRKK